MINGFAREAEYSVSERPPFVSVALISAGALAYDDLAAEVISLIPFVLRFSSALEPDHGHDINAVKGQSAVGNDKNQRQCLISPVSEGRGFACQPKKLPEKIALERKRHETEKARQWHLEDFPLVEERNVVDPLGA